jgi:hypothetical protein
MYHRHRSHPVFGIKQHPPDIFIFYVLLLKAQQAGYYLEIVFNPVMNFLQ